jgi:hypothetical protein
VYRIDMLVEWVVVIEVKVVEKLAPVHTSQVLSYLRLADLHVDLLFNFNVAALAAGAGSECSENRDVLRSLRHFRRLRVTAVDVPAPTLSRSTPQPRRGFELPPSRGYIAALVRDGTG